MNLVLRNATYNSWNVYSVTRIKEKYGFRVKLIYDKNDEVIQQKSGYRTMKEANNVRNEVIGQLTNHSYVVYSNIKVSDYYRYWLDDVMRKNITYNTYMSYRNAVENYIIREYGDTKITTLNQSHIQKLYNKVATEHESIVRLVKTIMNTSLNYAKMRNVVSTNVALEVRLPKNISKKEYKKVKIDSSKTLTIEQTKKLIEVCKDTPIYLQVMFGVLMGLRISEINGLKYSDIDYVNRKIYVERQLGKNIHNENINIKKKTLTKQEIKVKTKSSERWVDIPDLLYEAILEERVKYEKNRQRRVNDKTNQFRDNNYICCSTYGSSRSRGFHSQYYKKILKDNGLPIIEFHDLRHTYTTLLIRANFSLKAISKLLGHSTEIVTVDVYCDKNKIIYDCLELLEPYIESVIPKATSKRSIYDYTDIDFELDDYYEKLVN